MTLLYTIRARFDKDSEANKGAWDFFIQWSRLEQLTELVSMDTGLNELLVEPDYDNDDDWKEIVYHDYHDTYCFKSQEYALRKTSINGRFNLMAVTIQPSSDCVLMPVENYDFIGYDLVDHYFDTSALSNCGGFDETFLPSELNNYGLISNYEQAYTIWEKLLKNNPDEEHADTNVVGIWRHQTIGR